MQRIACLGVLDAGRGGWLYVLIVLMPRSIQIDVTSKRTQIPIAPKLRKHSGEGSALTS